MRALELPMPILKWAGGKRQLLEEIDTRLPNNFERYYEPFFGGGALFFHLKPKDAYINDINRALVCLYQVVRDDSVGFCEILSEIDEGLAQKANCAKEYYYAQRSRYNELIESKNFAVETAALMVFLNKHCFNGLYRVNGKGQFNVPYNNSLRKSFTQNNIEMVSELLRTAHLTCGDFESCVDDASENDFIFFDSPYAPLNDTSFEAYTKEGFSEENHRRLASLFKKLDARGCKVMLTNHDTPLIRELYSQYRIDVVEVSRSINSDVSKRKGTEVIITNYLG